MGRPIYLSPAVCFLIIFLFGGGATYVILKAISSVNWVSYPENQSVLIDGTPL